MGWWGYAKRQGLNKEGSGILWDPLDSGTGPTRPTRTGPARPTGTRPTRPTRTGPTEPTRTGPTGPDQTRVTSAEQRLPIMDHGSRIMDQGSWIMDHGSCFGMNDHPGRDTDVRSRLSKSTIEDLPFYIGFVTSRILDLVLA